MNIVTISGHLGKDMDLRIDEQKRPEGELSVAINDFIGMDQETQQPRYWTTWQTAVLRGDRAIALQDRLYKGRSVWITGQLRTRNYRIGEDKTMPLTYILVEKIEFDHRASPATAEHAGQRESQ